jgi:predicted dehydrogenase
MSKIKWGIIGLGNIACSFVEDFKYVNGGSVVAAASRSLAKAQKFCQKFGIKKAYGSYGDLFHDPEIDVVYVATPHNLHFQNSVDAIKGGKAVLCEKPITTNPEDCRKLAEIAVSTDSFLMEAMWTYFLPPFQLAKQWVDDGKIGSLKHIKADFAFMPPYDPQTRLFSPDLAGGALLDIGIYPIALCWWITGKRPQKIKVSAQHAATGVDETEVMVFEYEDGVYASLFASLSCEMPNEALIVGTEGYIRIPEFFKSRECMLVQEGKLVEHYMDDRRSAGYNFEIEAVQKDLKAGRTESKIMPIASSLALQEMMQKVHNQF